MGYKLLGVGVWRVARWYLHRRFPHAGRKAAVGAGVAVGAVAAVAAVRQRAGSGSSE
jgi:hypothetical protein